MKITHPDFIKNGYYSILDIQEYLLSLKLKEARHKLEMDEKSVPVTAYIDHTLTAFRELLKMIDKSQLPLVYREIEKAIAQIEELKHPKANAKKNRNSTW